MKYLIERLREGKKANAPYEPDYAIPPTKLNREAADALELQDKEIEALRQDGSRLTAERDTLFNRATTAEFENATLRADAERYRYIRTGEVFIEPMTHDNGVKEFYAAAGELPGKYYVDMRDFDMDVDAAIAGEKK